MLEQPKYPSAVMLCLPGTCDVVLEAAGVGLIDVTPVLPAYCFVAALYAMLASSSVLMNSHPAAPISTIPTPTLHPARHLCFQASCLALNAANQRPPERRHGTNRKSHGHDMSPNPTQKKVPIPPNRAIVIETTSSKKFRAGDLTWRLIS